MWRCVLHVQGYWGRHAHVFVFVQCVCGGGCLCPYRACFLVFAANDWDVLSNVRAAFVVGVPSR